MALKNEKSPTNCVDLVLYYENPSTILLLKGQIPPEN